MLKFSMDKGGTCYGPELKMLNRHGLISGATGTGKTITLKCFVEQLSAQGIPTFLVDIKGDLNGFETPGEASEGLKKHLNKIGAALPEFDSYPVQHWDLYGEKGFPIRTTVSDMGPLLMSRLLSLSDVQTSVLHTLFKMADDEGLLLLDFKDLKALVEFAYEETASLPDGYGRLNRSSLGAILRQLTVLEQQDVARFFGENCLELDDFQKCIGGKGVINRLEATTLFQNPVMYSTFLLWLLSELYENFEEVGDPEKPKMVFFFDEAHLIFDKIPPVLLAQIEKVVRLIRSKGIGIYFISQSPTDLPESVLSQLGNRIQHALRAYTAKEIKQLRIAAQGFRVNPELALETVLLELGVGEAVVSFLTPDGVPEVTQRVYILPPKSRMGHVDGVAYFADAGLKSKYAEPVDRESAYEMLEKRAQKLEEAREQEAKAVEREKDRAQRQRSQKQSQRRSRGRRSDSALEKVGKSFISSLSRSVGSSLARGLMGTLKKL